MIDLNKEAEKYYNSNIDETNIPREHYEQEIITLMSDFAGDSKFVKKQILQAQINLCNSALDWNNIQDETSEYIENKLKQLKQELKQLEDVDKNS